LEYRYEGTLEYNNTQVWKNVGIIVLQYSFIPGYYCTPTFLHTWVLLYFNIPSCLGIIVLQRSFIPGYYCTPTFLHTWVLLYFNIPSYLDEGILKYNSTQVWRNVGVQ
jgi:hypothetical protein